MEAWFEIEKFSKEKIFAGVSKTPQGVLDMRKQGNNFRSQAIGVATEL